MSGGFFRGTSADQDTRFSNKQAKLMKSQKFAPELENLVDMSKVKMDVMKPWIANRVTELLGFEDEVLINFIYSLLDVKEVNGKEVQIQITGFMEKNTGKFMKELWTLLLSAEKNESGVPQQFLDAKIEETRKKQAEMDRITIELQNKKEKENRELEHELSKKMDGGFGTKGSNVAVEPFSKQMLLKKSGGHPKDEKNDDQRNGGRNRVSRFHSADSSPGRSPSHIRRSISNSRSYSGDGQKSRSVSRSPIAGGHRSPRKRPVTPVRGRSSSVTPPRRRSRPYRLRSQSISRSPVRRRLHSPIRRRRSSPMQERSSSPIRRRSPSPTLLRHNRSRSPIRHHGSPSPLRRRRSPSPLRRRRSPSPPLRRRRSPSPYRRRRSPSPLRRRRSPSPLRRRRSPAVRPRRSPSPVRRRSPSPVRRRSPSPVRRRSPSPVRRRSPSPVRGRSPSPVRGRSPSPVRRRSPSPVWHGKRSPLSSRHRYQRSSSTSPRRSVSPVGGRSPVLAGKRSFPPRSPSQDASSSQSPTHHSPSLEMTKGSSKELLPLPSPGERTRNQEKLSPVSHQTSDSFRSPQRDVKDQQHLLNQGPDLSPSQKRSPLRSKSPPVIRKMGVGIDRRSPSPERQRKQIARDVSKSPPRNGREQKHNHHNPQTNKEAEQADRTREGRDYKSTSSHKRSGNEANIVKQKDSIMELHYKDEHSTEPRSRSNYMDSKKDQEVKRTVACPETIDGHKSPTMYKDPQMQDKQHTSFAQVDKKSGEHNRVCLINVKDSDRDHKSVLTENTDSVNAGGAINSGSGESDKHRPEKKEKRKHRRSHRQEVASDDDSYDSEYEDKKEAKKRRKEEKKSRKEEKRRRREERRRRKEERRAEKLKFKDQNEEDSSGDEDSGKKNLCPSDDEETHSEQKKLEIELRNKALESLKAKKGISR